MKVCRDPQFFQVLHVILQDPKAPALDNPDNYWRNELRLDQHICRTKTVRITLPIQLGIHFCDEISAHAQYVLNAAYSWLTGRIRCWLLSLGEAIERTSLDIFRRQFLINGGESALQHVWLVKVADERVSYAVDVCVIERSLQSAHRLAEYQQPPATVAVALLANSIPIETSYSRRALAEQGSVHMTLDEAPYKNVNADFRAAQSTIYADEMMLTPLVSDRRGHLLAAYPAAMQNGFADLLSASKIELDTHFRSNPGLMRPPPPRQPPLASLSGIEEVSSGVDSDTR